MGGLLILLGSILGAANHVFTQLLHLNDGSWAQFFAICTVVWFVRNYGSKTLIDLQRLMLRLGSAFKAAADRLSKWSKSISLFFDPPNKKVRRWGRRKRQIDFERRLVAYGLSLVSACAVLAFYAGYNIRMAEPKLEPLRPPYGQSFADRFNTWPFLEPGRGGPGSDNPSVAPPETMVPQQQPNFSARQQKPRKIREMRDPWNFPRF
jgi:hypothetical protein